MAFPATPIQIPSESILDKFNRQAYLGNQYAFGVANASLTGTSENPLIYLANPAVTTSGFPTGYKGLFCNFMKLACLSGAQSVALRFYLNPTVSVAGTSKTAVNMRPATANSSIATLQQSPTVSAKGTFVTSLFASTTSDEGDFLIVLDPGNSLLVTAQASADTTIDVSLGWFEL